jgi:C-terminal processing protease CtpA/Prc
MFERVRTEYAFNGIENKEPNYEQLRSTLEPRIAEAEQQEDGEAYYLALRDFTQAFKDGHVGINDGGRFEQPLFGERYGSGYGFAIREMDDDRVIVTYVVENGPAARAGIEVGAEVTAFNDKPIEEALRAVEPWNGPFSTQFGREYQQQRFLLRAPLGTEARITFRNGNDAQETATLRAIAEEESFQVTDPFAFADPAALPVEYGVLPEGTGYVRVNSNFDDLNLVVRLWERALSTFEQFRLENVIIDMRRNGGGASLGLASYLTDQEIEMGQLEYYSEATEQFEGRGTPERILPADRQFRFPNMALLVDQFCYSACELEAYALSQVPDMLVIGQYPTAGVEAEVARGQFQMPEGISIQVPTGRFVKNGEIFLEGKGVEPTIRIPIDEDTVSVEEDVVLQRAEEELQNR